MAVHSGYRFADVLVDAAKRQLFVRGQEAACRPLAFELLLQLCEAAGAVVPREEVFRRLWGDDYVPSDEALTQIVHRLRSALGDQGKLVRTVRGVGLRLDTKVVPLAAEKERPAAPLSDFSTRPFGTPAAPAPARSPRRLRRGLLLGLAAALLLVGGWGLRALRRPRPLDSGYLLTAADLGSPPAAAAVTADLLRRAFAAESRGDRSQAVELLETVHRTDPATPVAAVFRVLWGHPEAYPGEGARWAAAAESRLTARSSPYTRLFVRYAGAAANDQTAAEQASLSALLNLRPGAWRLRLARAHLALARHEREAARADLERIPVHAVDQRGLAFVLADRASLGDTDGVERALRSGLLAGREAFAWYVRARLERSRLRPAASVAACDRSVAAAIRLGQPDLVLPARLLGAASAFEAGDAAGAAARLDAAAVAAREIERPDYASDALGLGAYLAWQSGDPAGRDRRLAEAFRETPPDDTTRRISFTLLALWTGGTSVISPKDLADIAPSPGLQSARSLLLARRELAADRPDAAARLLRQSVAEGIDHTAFAEDAALLARQLVPAEKRARVPPPRVDPPYPNPLRLAAAWEIRRLGPPP